MSSSTAAKAKGPVRGALKRKKKEVNEDLDQQDGEQEEGI